MVSEGFENPIGFYDSTPTFSWQLPADGSVKAQTGYHIVAANTKATQTDSKIEVSKAFYGVKGDRAKQVDLTHKLQQQVGGGKVKAGKFVPEYFRREFRLKDGVRSARLHVTESGKVYSLKQVNGETVCDLEPGQYEFLVN